METRNLKNKPAFPETYENMDGTKQNIPGMNKRFYAACAAMQGLLSNGRITELFEKAKTNTDQERVAIIKGAYQLADELLSQENKE
jgi:hypothetical protein